MIKALVLAAILSFTIAWPTLADELIEASLPSPEAALDQTDRARSVGVLRSLNPAIRNELTVGQFFSSDPVIDAHDMPGLTDPKGMAFFQGELVVADVTNLVRIDLETGHVLERIRVDGAQFLYRVTTDGETLWVTDRYANAVFAYDGDDVSIWLQTNDQQAQLSASLGRSAS